MTKIKFGPPGNYPKFPIPKFGDEINKRLKDVVITEAYWSWDNQGDQWYQLGVVENHPLFDKVVSTIVKIINDSRLPNGKLPLPDIWR